MEVIYGKLDETLPFRNPSFLSTPNFKLRFYDRSNLSKIEKFESAFSQEANLEFIIEGTNMDY